MARLRLDESRATARGDGRRLSHGRPWSGALKASGPSARVAMPSEVRKAAAWGIDGEGPARATVFPRAERRMQRGAGLSQVSSGPKDVLPTLLVTRAQVPYVSGGVAGAGRPMQAREAAVLMGIGLGSEVWRAAERRLSEAALWGATADAVDGHHVRALWRNAAEMAKGRGRALEGRELQYAGMFAGAIDSIFTGGRAVGWPLRYAAVAEKVWERRECLSEAYFIPKARRYSTARQMAERLGVRLDVLSATPACQLLSSARRPKGKGSERQRSRAWRELQGRARRRLLADVEMVRRVAERCEPQVILLEETAGLRSHHKALYEEVQTELRSWPYAWRHVEIDCSELGAAHHRKRLLWVGVRLD
jgi:hypothetical protein